MIEYLKSYYKKAIRTSLLAQDKLTKNYYHLFSVIEMQTENEYSYNIPNSEWEENCVRAKQSGLDGFSFYLTIDEITSVDEALNIFNQPIKYFFIDKNKISFINI